MCDGIDRTDVFATSTQHDACIGINDGSLFSIFFFKFVGVHVAEVYAFSTGYTFFVVYLWVPKYFGSRYSFICFFRHVLSLIGVACIYSVINNI